MRFLFLALSSYLGLWVDQVRFIPALLPSPSTSTTGGRSLQDKKAEAIAFIHDQMATHALPGLALAVVYKNETIIASGFGTKQYGNDTNAVTADTIFQIGSFSKTFIALGIGKLVDEGRLHWDDPVKLRLPWFQLNDKYAEEYTTLGDLLAMNSVFASGQGDEAWMLGGVDERAAVRAAAYLDTDGRPLRPGYAYANMNYEILGQVIEHQTNQTWSQYLHTTFFTPLGMTHTYGAVREVPSSGDLSFAHYHCNKLVAGPFDQSASPEVVLNGNDYIAAGSIVSSAGDLAIFSKFLLSKGAGVFRSPAIVDTMITGHNINTMFSALGPFMGYAYDADGDALTAGYGFDAVGDIMYGYQYFDKGGDTFAFKTRNGFIPTEDLGVVLLSNSEGRGGAFSDSWIEDRIRTYLLGIFLDVPQATLKATYESARAIADASQPSTPCDAHLFQGSPWSSVGSPVPTSDRRALVGTYVSAASPAFYGTLTLSEGNGSLLLHYGRDTAPVLVKEDGGYLWTTATAGYVFASSLDIQHIGTNQTQVTLLRHPFVKKP
ncbi:hypothetical protein SPRG_14397 [Saprolegnia parasitica CBS 223.65]|uniref:Beta-lactamase-related domain-containing protein n=1 Tax=Saprolegnia parasitica (strain CBS 223.65) TaxID=695850 RepID=A0A067C139_SAPPC|nr:hypothetical protein SPRG_14397 [Saprolegnia parasitica CBS 223.65]KDO20261.1 hypothetical protein SPRG_14397 [Saprolegnia parasitica CBS 223.65]|eukprot:XP_012209001.1 hypothetical protein SPRG_14397 [Saprolegnia parasitica CBS 223.65]